MFRGAVSGCRTPLNADPLDGDETMDPVEFLTAIVEASVGLLGFTGVVVALGRDSGSSSAVDKTRMMNLLGWSSITLGSTLLSLVLISAEVQPQ